MPSLGGPRRTIASPFGLVKLEWSVYPISLTICLPVLTECTNVTDGQTDTHTHTYRHSMTAKATLDANIARQFFF